MPFLKRLHRPTVDAPSATPVGTGGITTGEPFSRPKGGTTGGLSSGGPTTGDLLARPTSQSGASAPKAPRGTSPLSDATPARPRPSREDNQNELKARIQNRQLAALDPRMDLGNAEEVRRMVEERFASVLETEGLVLTRIERLRLFEAISDEILGYGPIEPLLKEASVIEIMVNGPKQSYVERSGKPELSEATFQDDDPVMRVIDRIVSPLGRRIDESSSAVDARLPDGSRVNVIIPPIALNGPTLAIRTFSQDPFTVDDMIGFGTFTMRSGRIRSRSCRSSVTPRGSGFGSRGVGVLTAQGTTSGYVSSFLPLALGGALFLMNPNYVTQMFVWPFVCRSIGAGAMMVLGFLAMKKIAAIEVSRSGTRAGRAGAGRAKAGKGSGP